MTKRFPSQTVFHTPIPTRRQIALRPHSPVDGMLALGNLLVESSHTQRLSPATVSRLVHPLSFGHKQAVQSERNSRFKNHDSRSKIHDLLIKIQDSMIVLCAVKLWYGKSHCLQNIKGINIIGNRMQS